MSRAVLSPDTERLSRLTGLLQATLPLNPLATRPAGIFVTHILNDRVERHFERLRRESAPHVDWRLFHNTFSLTDVAAGRSFIPRRVVDMRLRQAVAWATPYEKIMSAAMFGRGVPMWGGALALVVCALASPQPQPRDDNTDSNSD